MKNLKVSTSPSPRSLSEAQESAQLLSGPQLPTIVLEPLVQNVEVEGRVIGVVNYTPYDGHLEKVCHSWQRVHGDDSPSFRSFSFGPNADAVAFSEKVIAMELLQEPWVQPGVDQY